MSKMEVYKYEFLQLYITSIGLKGIEDYPIRVEVQAQLGIQSIKQK
ncbi:hypothetical protein [Bacillus marasmi]|nr:hypothetical protein [Bacillus marasmi]